MRYLCLDSILTLEFLLRRILNMKNVMKRFFSSFLSLVLLCTLVSGISIASDTTETKAASYESAWFPMSTMNLTQIAYESYSHTNSNHIDCIGSTYAFAPFTGTVKYTSSNYGVTVFQSNNKVYYADGSLDYMTVMFMHGTCLYSKGQTVSQGTNMYKLGGLGSNGASVYGTHLDLGVYRGQRSDTGSTYSRFGNTFCYDAFYINTKKTTSIINKGACESGNWVNNNAPYNYSSLWKTLGQTSVSVPHVTYQVYANGKWYSNVTDNSDYAGVFGYPISGVYANLDKGNITYRVHKKGGSWYSAVVNRSDYAGSLGSPIDGICMKTDTGKTIHYRVHIKGGSWLPYVTGYNTSDSNNGYAGIFGQEIDGIQIYLS